MNDLGEKIMNLRKKSGISQEELGFELDVSRQTVFRWEAGIRQPNAEKLEQLCRYFGVTADYFLSDRNSEEIAFTEAEKLAEEAESPKCKTLNKTAWLIGVICSVVVWLISTAFFAVVCTFSFKYPGGADAAIAVEGVWFLVLLGILSLLSFIVFFILILLKKRKCNCLGTKKLQTNCEESSKIDKKQE